MDCLWRKHKEAELLWEKHHAGCSQCQMADMGPPCLQCDVGDNLSSVEADAWYLATNCRSLFCGDPHPDCPWTQ